MDMDMYMCMLMHNIHTYEYSYTHDSASLRSVTLTRPASVHRNPHSCHARTQDKHLAANHDAPARSRMPISNRLERSSYPTKPRLTDAPLRVVSLSVSLSLSAACIMLAQSWCELQ